MKKALYLVLAVVMLLPMVVACGGNALPQGDQYTLGNVKVINLATFYADEDNQNATPTDADKTDAEIFSGEVVAYSAAVGTPLTAGDVAAWLDQNNFNGNAVKSGSVYVEYAGTANDTEAGLFWAIYVNGKEVSADAEVKAEDKIEIIYGK
jgi:hypothetical protein